MSSDKRNSLIGRSRRRNSLIDGFGPWNTNLFHLNPYAIYIYLHVGSPIFSGKRKPNAILSRVQKKISLTNSIIKSKRYYITVNHAHKLYANLWSLRTGVKNGEKYVLQANYVRVQILWRSKQITMCVCVCVCVCFSSWTPVENILCDVPIEGDR